MSSVAGVNCPLSDIFFCLVSTCLLQAGDSLGDGSSILDFMSMKSYSDASLDISMLGSLGRLCWACSHRQAPLEEVGPLLLFLVLH